MPPVRVGDREYTVEPFNGRKAILAGRMVARIAKKVPNLLQTDAVFTREYADANAIRITRAMALAHEVWKEELAAVTDVQWEQLGGVIVLPQKPTWEVRLAAMFTEAFETAEEEILKLLALVVMPNGDLAEAAKKGDIKDVLVAKADELLDAGTIGELAELAAVAAEQIRDELADDGGGLGKLKALWASRVEDSTMTPSSSESAEPQAETIPAPQPPTPAPAPTPPAPQPTPPAISRAQDSSTDSPMPTDGPMSESSTERPGSSLSASAIA